MSATPRLNPKLTMRRLAPVEYEASDQGSARSGFSDNTDATSETDSTTAESVQLTKKINPNRHLLHCGVWIPKEVSGLIFKFSNNFSLSVFSGPLGVLFLALEYGIAAAKTIIYLCIATA